MVGDKMKINKKTAKLICDIEYIIGGYCWNDNASYGNGDYIRYPVWANVTNKIKNETTGKFEETQEWEKISYFNVNHRKPALPPKDVKTLEYRFGANELVIGRAIVKTLEYLEERYGLDFAELEKYVQE